MIKVLIVDDEKLVRIGVRSSLQWESHGYVVVGEACNGEEALKKIHSLQPDLVLTDIRMPKMDGIELLKEIEKEDLPVETVIMSCYNEFELVRAAMRHGANDYILKLTFSDEEMLEVLERNRQKIMDKQKKRKEESVTLKTDFREKFIKRVLDSSTSVAELESYLEKLHIALDIHHMTLLLFSIDPFFDSARLAYSLPDKKTVILLGNLLHDDLIMQKQGDVFILDEKNGLFLVCLNPSAQADTIAGDIKKKAKTFFNLSLSMVILDEAFCKIFLFSQVRQAANLLTERKFSLGRGCVFTVTDKKAFSSQEITSPVADVVGEIKGLADLDKLMASVRHLCKMRADMQSSRNTCLVLFTEIFYKTAGLLRIYGGTIDGLNQKCGLNLSMCLLQLTFLTDAPDWFQTYLSFINDYLTDCAKNWKRDEILTAINYINENYNLPISAQKVARLVGLSETYFSTLFKKEAGIVFSEYLTNLRMEKAKSLLKDKNIFIYEVCEYVGYSDANYFGKVFKKHTRLSPEAYRKSWLSEK